jgi:hypothetical protein
MGSDTLRRAGMVALAAGILCGCASMSKDECVTVDWRTVGYEDGAAGQGAERLASRRKACAEHGVAPDLTAYRTGRDEGLREYCNSANGFRVGASGTVYGGACPADLEPAFADAYQAGRKLWRLESQLNDANHGIAYRRAEIARIDEALTASGFSVVGEASTPEERAQALLDAKSLAERRGRLKAELATLERDRGHYEAELEEYREELAYNY